MSTITVVLRDPETDRQALILALKTFWYLLVAYFIYTIVAVILKQEIATYAGAICYILFMAAEFMPRGKIKSLGKVLLGFIYLFFGVIAAIITVVTFTTPMMETAAGVTTSKPIAVVLGGLITVLFIWRSYHDINTYSNLVEVVKRKLGIRFTQKFQKPKAEGTRQFTPKFQEPKAEGTRYQYQRGKRQCTRCGKWFGGEYWTHQEYERKRGNKNHQ